LRNSANARRMLLVSSAGLEQAKRLISSYKQSEISSMNSELWRAKKVVDSTLHPGTFFLYEMVWQWHAYTNGCSIRHRRARFPSLPHVVLCPFQSGRDGGYAHARPSGTTVR